MAMNSEGAQMVAVLWSLTAIVLVFLVLRAYTRIVCVASYGIDDHFYALTCVSFPLRPWINPWSKGSSDISP